MWGIETPLQSALSRSGKVASFADVWIETERYKASHIVYLLDIATNGTMGNNKFNQIMLMEKSDRSTLSTNFLLLPSGGLIAS